MGLTILKILYKYFVMHIYNNYDINVLVAKQLLYRNDSEDTQGPHRHWSIRITGSF